MNILVTGGAGYIGSVVAAQLVRAGHRVTVFDNLSHGKRRAVPAGVEFVLGDVADCRTLKDVISSRHVDAVMHFAGVIEAGESMRVPELYFRNNTANTLSLLQAMLEQGVLHFVFSSTAALYGDPESTPIDEMARLCPTNAYGESKLLVERMLEWFHRVHGLRYATLRYFNAAGAWGDFGEDHRPESHLIPLILRVALGQSTHIAIFGNDYETLDGTCVRDYVHVSDLSRAHLLVLDKLDQNGRMIYNLGNGRGFSVREVLEVARRVTGRPLPAIEAPRRPGDPAILVASSLKIQRELNWVPEYSELEAIVASAWEWQQRHPNGYEE